MDEGFFMKAMGEVGLPVLVFDENTPPPPKPEAPSPFLPGTNIQFAWDSTSLGYFKTCPRLYQYQMIEGWQPKGENIHLRYGIEYHKALEDYEDLRASLGSSHDNAVKDTIQMLLERIHDWDPDPNLKKRSEAIKSKESLVRTVIWYLDQFENDPAQTVTLQNGKPAMEVSFRFELEYGPRGLEAYQMQDELLGSQPYLLCGHLDRLVTFQDQLFVMDRKTTTTTPSEFYFNQYEPHNQMTLYTLASQVIFEQPIRGVIIDVAQIAVGFSRFVRGITYRTPDQITEWLQDLRYHLGQAERYATEGYWPQNDTACDKFGGCKFREICSKSPQVREAFLKSNFEKAEPWNPLKVR